MRRLCLCILLAACTGSTPPDLPPVTERLKPVPERLEQLNLPPELAKLLPDPTAEVAAYAPDGEWRGIQFTTRPEVASLTVHAIRRQLGCGECSGVFVWIEDLPEDDAPAHIAVATQAPGLPEGLWFDDVEVLLETWQEQTGLQLLSRSARSLVYEFDDLPDPPDDFYSDIEDLLTEEPDDYEVWRAAVGRSRRIELAVPAEE